jgi:Cd2+/Zn2+-exporting ATPase
MNDRLELDIPVLLPEIPDVADACVHRLISTLAVTPGIMKAHVLENEGEPPKLCVHFDTTIITFSRVREMVRATGAQITGLFGHVIWKVRGISHERRARTIGDALKLLPGVFEANATAAGTVILSANRSSRMP